MPDYNLAAALYRMADTQPDTLAIALPAAPGKPLPNDGPIPYRMISYGALARETNRIARGLLKSGFRPGDRVVLLVPPGLEFFTLTFAFLQSGIIPVLIDPGIGFNNLKTCIREADPAGFIGITKAQLARVLLGWGRGSIKKTVTAGPRVFGWGTSLDTIRKAGGPDGPVECFAARPADLAAILFTSGSTGLSKGVPYTHGNFYHQVDIIRHTFGMQPGEIDLPTFPPFALFNPALGISSIIPDMNPTRPALVDPERIIRAVLQFGVTSMFGSPALIDRVGRYGEKRGIKLPSLKRVLSAGAPVPARTLERFSSMLAPDVEILTPYGATEAMPVASVGSRHILRADVRQRSGNGGGICLGAPVKMLDVRIIRITDEPLPSWSDDLEAGAGQVGEIVVKGENVTSAYFHRDPATRLAKIADGGGFWHRMGDLGYRDADGTLWFCGRKAHRVQLENRELYSVQCESIFNRHPQVYRTALVAAGKKPVLIVELDREAIRPNREQIARDLLEWAAANDLTRDIQKVLFHPSFPVDIRHNAKIFREKLAVWAARQ